MTVQTHRDLAHTWDLNNEQFNRLVTTLQANQRLLDCLKVTTVTNRAEIEAGLLLPPEGMGG